ncbi:MAG: hypothetical protein DMG11_21240 [Acidobacteria bacterium]|nr:MAG: hypothetical protein DMG11_21240 [Acidobacteriota bacterium]
MKSIVVLLVILSAVAVGWAQVGSLGGISRGPGASIGIPVIQPFGLSTSILDSAANLFIFDVSYSYSRDPVITTEPQSLLPRITVTAKTHVTVITNTGTPLKPVDFDGNLQVLGAGRQAVYAFSNMYANGPTFVATRRLLALSIAGTALISPVPSVDVPINADVKLAAAADSSAADVISVIDAGNPLSLTPTAAPVLRRFARFVKYSVRDGFVTGTPIPLP